MNELHLFAGIGGGILGGLLLGHTPVCAVEIDPYCRRVLLGRQRDGILPRFALWDDVRTFDGKPWKGIADVVCGGFPCTDISCAGKGAGIEGEESGLWNDMARVIGEVRPRFVFLENSPMLVVRGLDRVLADLSCLGFDARWGVVSGENAGSPQERERLWLLAKFQPGQTAVRTEDGWFCKWCGGEVMSECSCDHGEWRCLVCGEWSYPFHNEERDTCSFCGSRDVVDSTGKRGCGGDSQWEDAEDAWKPSIDPRHNPRGMGYWDIEPDVDRVAQRIANRVDRHRAIGNCQIPAVVALAWSVLEGRELK